MLEQRKHNGCKPFLSSNSYKAKSLVTFNTMEQRKFIKGTNAYLVRQVGVGKENIFIDEEDYLRFVLALEFYTRDRAVNLWQMFFKSKHEGSFYISDAVADNLRESCRVRKEVVRERLKEGRTGAPRMVTILGFSLLPRSYYLLVKPVVERGLERFMQKMCGYVRYFNRKHSRRGCLFRANYERFEVRCRKESLQALNFVHSRPLRAWINCRRHRKKSVCKKSALKNLQTYKYSSYMDYAGTKNFPSVTSRGFLYDHLRGKRKYQKMFNDYVERNYFPQK